MTKEVLTRVQYLEVLNESLRHHPEWQPGMAFVFWPPGSSAKRAKGLGFSGPAETRPIFDQIEYVAAAYAKSERAQSGERNESLPQSSDFV